MKLHKRTFVTIQIVDDKVVKDLNNKFLGKKTSTDVLAFNLNEKMPDGSCHLGEIIISKQKARQQAKQASCSVEEELVELAKHGMLHLLGIHHEEEDV